MSLNKGVARPIYLLDSRHMMATVLYLDEAGPSKRVEIYDNVSRNMNMPEKIGLLLDKGIVEETVTYEGVKLRLTAAGEEVAGHLREIERHLADDPERTDPRPM